MEAKKFQTCTENEQDAIICVAVSVVVWHNEQIAFAWPPFLIMRSAVHNLFCKSNHAKNLHLFSDFDFYSLSQSWSNILAVN